MLPSSEVRTVSEARQVLAQRRSPKVLGAIVLVELVARLVLGDWSWRDPAVGAALLLVYPFGEWAIHVYLLHGIESWSTARAHASHHRGPNDLDTVLLDWQEIALICGLAVPLVATLLALPFGFAPTSILSGCIVGSAMVGVYEWTHFLIHTAHKPQSRLYRSIWKAHRLHHFKNEHYWHGITSTIADRAFRTNPDQSDVPRSPTARSLKG